jgi:type II secretory pathway pseudopilin PulG
LARETEYFFSNGTYITALISSSSMEATKRPTMIIALLAVALAATVIAAIASNSATAQQQNNQLIYRIQETKMSSAAPVAHTGNLPHAVVFALPLRDDGKIYTGRVTFTASKPIEVEVLHVYDPALEPDAEHGAPPTAVLNGTTITYSHMESTIVESNYVLGDVPTASCTFEFAGSGLVFHKRSSEPFTVTYTIDAAVRPLTQ